MFKFDVHDCNPEEGAAGYVVTFCGITALSLPKTFAPGPKSGKVRTPSRVSMRPSGRILRGYGSSCPGVWQAYSFCRKTLFFSVIDVPAKSLFSVSGSLIFVRGARKLMGENLKPVWAEFSTLS